MSILALTEPLLKSPLKYRPIAMRIIYPPTKKLCWDTDECTKTVSQISFSKNFRFSFLLSYFIDNLLSKWLNIYMKFEFLTGNEAS